MLIAGRVADQRGRGIEGAVVIAYNADAHGLYNPPDSPTRVPRIRATVSTDADGRFQVLTVRPAPYPDHSEPAHLHFEIHAAGFRRQYSTLWFDGDPLITDARRNAAEQHFAEHPEDATAIVRTESLAGLDLVRHTIELETD